MQVVTYKGKDYLIKTEPLTNGELADISIWADMMIESRGGNPARSSPATLDQFRKYSQCLVIIKKGISFGNSDTTPDKVTFTNLFRLGPDFIKFITDEYQKAAQPPVVTNAEDAKKKSQQTPSSPTT